MEAFYEELFKVVDEIKPYYDVDKIKSWGVYIYTKDGEDGSWGENVFDIMKDEIIFHKEDYVIPDEVMPIIRKIQSRLIGL